MAQTISPDPSCRANKRKEWGVGKDTDVFCACKRLVVCPEGVNKVTCDRCFALQASRKAQSPKEEEKDVNRK